MNKHTTKLTRSRQEWIEWGLLDVPALDDYVYEKLPEMDRYCEADLRRGLQTLQIQLHTVETKIATYTDDDQKRIDALRNVKSCMLIPQIELINSAIAQITDAASDSYRTQEQIAMLAETFLTIVDENADPSELRRSLDDLQRLFAYSGRTAASDRVDRLRTQWLPL